MQECIFCKIINGKNKQSKSIIYQDDLVTAFMDRIQPHPGHILVVPNNHIVSILEIDDKLAGKLFQVTTKIAKIVKKLFNPHGIDIYQCNGKCAGQSVLHMHIHIFPREYNDKLFSIYPEHKYNRPKEKIINNYAQKIKELL